MPGEMHTAQVSIDGGLNQSLGEAKGQTDTIIYLIQFHNILLNSILPIFPLLYIINIEKQMSLPNGKLLFKYPIG